MTELEFAQRGRALWITLARPQQLNALTPGMASGLLERFRGVVSDNAVSVVVLTGAGKAFCAGADIGAPPPSETPEAELTRVQGFMKTVGDLTLAIEECPKPVIAAVNGMALAAGIELLLSCDLVIASETAKLGDGHARYGLLPGGGSSVRLPRRLPPAKARWLMFSGELLPATHPLVADLLTATVPAEELTVSVERYIDILSQRSPLVLRRMKELAKAGEAGEVMEGLAFERAVNAEHFHSHDRREGLSAFRERRTPNFLGR